MLSRLNNIKELLVLLGRQISKTSMKTYNEKLKETAW